MAAMVWAASTATVASVSGPPESAVTGLQAVSPSSRQRTNKSRRRNPGSMQQSPSEGQVQASPDYYHRKTGFPGYQSCKHALTAPSTPALFERLPHTAQK